MAVRRYESREVVIDYDAQRCIRAAECSHGLPAVFDRQSEPWIRPEGADGSTIAAVVQRCPSGALTLRYRDNRPAEAPDPINTITIRPDGPLYARGRIAHAHGGGAALTEYARAALCRCGASAHKPFCDGRHEAVGFADAGGCHVRDRDRPAAPRPPTGTITLHPRPNGPLMIEGWLEIRSADGAALVVGDKCWLCRCGHSRSKPFCDGSHKAAGFIA